MNLDIVTPPAVEPISLQEAKDHLRLEISEDDALVSGLIRSARMLCETKQSITAVDTVWRLTLDCFPTNGGYWRRENRHNFGAPGWLPQANQGEIFLPRSPVTAIVAIRYLDGAGVLQTLPTSVYTLVPGRRARLGLKSGQVWPTVQSQIGAVQIDFRAGYADAQAVPEPIKTAMKLMIGAWYENREAVTAGSVSVLPLAVDHLLATQAWGSYA